MATEEINSKKSRWLYALLIIILLIVSIIIAVFSYKEKERRQKAELCIGSVILVEDMIIEDVENKANYEDLLNKFKRLEEWVMLVDAEYEKYPNIIDDYLYEKKQCYSWSDYKRHITYTFFTADLIEDSVKEYMENN